MQPHQFKPENPLHRLADQLKGVQGIAPRVLFWLLIAQGGLVLRNAFVAERTGVAYTPKFSVRSLPVRVKRSENPEGFRHVVTVLWLYGSFWIGGGLMIHGAIRRRDRLDPTSPSFHGQKALDDLGDWLDKENENRHRPLR